MKKYKDTVDMLYSVKEDLLILGLTGRTGAGCSTTAKILGKSYDSLDLQYESREEYLNQDKNKFEIIKNYISDHWEPFTIIEGSCVILSYIFETVADKKDPCRDLKNYLKSLQGGEHGNIFKIANDMKLYEEIDGLKYIFSEVQKYPLNKLDNSLGDLADSEIEAYYNLYIEKMPDYKDRVREILLQYTCYEIEKSKMQDKKPIEYHLYTYLLQKIGNNIRSSGEPYNDKFVQTALFNFAKRIDLLIELIIRYNKICSKKLGKKVKTRICIDAIRNVNESNYLKDKYRAYYLLSISVEEKDRKQRLQELNVQEKNSIDNIEYLGNYKAEAFFYQQNIAQCFEMADIHIYNEQVVSSHKFFLTWQLVKYITLMIHPGLITPTNLERCMQLAYNAKFNSGCLSRQVGAIVTGNDFSVRAVGWNDVPKGHLACNLRDVNEYCMGNHQECFSKYEIENNRFSQAVHDIKDSLTTEKSDFAHKRFPYCFKDIYIGYTGEKNQVMTRALHAEENAFLQISKYGGQGISGGYLFCTASPCELCSKKAFQLGIKNIYYIDPYPGIAQNHILACGEQKDRPKMNLFYGAIGEAYISLYKPLIAYKDELELLSGISCKAIARDGKINEYSEPGTMDLYYNSIEFSLEFKSRETIESIRKVDFEIRKGKYKKLERQLVWTGSSYDGTELVEGDCELEDYKNKISPYKYCINFKEEKGVGSNVQYVVRSSVKDETQLMHPYIAHYVKNPTRKLVLKVIIPKNDVILEDCIDKRYADFNMEIEHPALETYIKSKEIDEDRMEYSIEIDNPNLFYTYAIEWEFMKKKT